MTEIRTDVVALLTDIECLLDYPNLRRKSTGGAFTADEMALIGQARRGEMDAARRYAETVVEYHQSAAADLARVGELLDKYGADLPESTPLFAIAARMTAEDRAEFESIMDRRAPDGFYLAGGES